MRNTADKVPRQEGSCVSDDGAIYQAANRGEAQRAFRDWKQRWETLRPKAVACMERDLNCLLNLFVVPIAPSVLMHIMLADGVVR